MEDQQQHRSVVVKNTFIHVENEEMGARRMSRSQSDSSLSQSRSESSSTEVNSQEMVQVGSGSENAGHMVSASSSSRGAASKHMPEKPPSMLERIPLRSKHSQSSSSSNIEEATSQEMEQVGFHNAGHMVAARSSRDAASENKQKRASTCSDVDPAPGGGPGKVGNSKSSNPEAGPDLSRW